MYADTQYEPFFASCRAVLGGGQVLDKAAAEARFGPNTIGIRREIAGAVRPTSRDQVVELVKAASANRVPLYPISTGNNWGYGSGNPVADGCVVVDLSAMDQIISVNPQNGLAVLQPGVTQRMLRKYLDDNGLHFLCPVSGAGPDCSLVGNALERGYGITPHADHFHSSMSLEVVLPDGRLYRPPLAEIGCPDIDARFKYGVGPFIDGMFFQGSYGIVTEMTIALAKIPQRVEGFFFGVKHDDLLEDAVASVQDILMELGGVTGSINLMNTRRVMSMMEPYPSDKLDKNGIADEAFLNKLARRNQVMPWMGAGALYGNKGVVRAAKWAIRRKLWGTGSRLMFFTPTSVAMFHKLSYLVPFGIGRSLQNLFDTLNKTLQLLAGAPSEIALPLSYWLSGQLPADGKPMNPAKDGCGLIWYSPLVPMNGEVVREFSTMVNRVCVAHGIEPLITLTSLSDKCFDSTIPLLFDPQDADHMARARACYSALLAEGRQIGCTPYRAPIDAMGSFMTLDAPYWQIVNLLKEELDPQGLISPGRYSSKSG